MIVKWEPKWYELDQAVVVGDVDVFYLSENNSCFANGFMSDNDCEVEAEILGISHSELGAIKGIITLGLDYSIYLCDGNEIIINAEEYPGDIKNSTYVINEWSFDVQIRIIKKTGLSSKGRARIEGSKMRTLHEIETCRQECIKKYKALLNLTEAGWDR